MSPLAYLCVTLVLVVVVALTGMGPKGAKPVGRTRLMKVARVIMFGGVIVFGAIGLLGTIRP